ncbi:hypothetical protein VB636_01605, partial [Paracoccus sp. APAP_BH8]|uniref:hypothetical protein n=1 Tax=Paracoccus sp. APAP_BH8 TaxID=3110237 RepID=UPI002FD7D5B8
DAALHAEQQAVVRQAGIVLPGRPSMLNMSRCGWKCVASAQSTWLSCATSILCRQIKCKD